MLNMQNLTSYLKIKEEYIKKGTPKSVRLFKNT